MRFVNGRVLWPALSAVLAACTSLSGLSGGSTDSGVDGARPDSGHHDATTKSDTGTTIHPDVGAPDVHTVTDAGTDAAVCAHTLPPPPPTTTSSAPKDVSIVLALRMFTSGLTSTVTDAGVDGGPSAFDLDHQCTCPGPPSCASATMSPNCDEPGGVDIAENAFAQMLDTQLAGGSKGDINTRIENGLFTLLLAIQDYNGEANDESVSVGVFTGSGIAGDAGPPKWDGTDVWNVDPDSTVGTGVTTDAGQVYEPRYGVTDAYVTNHVLVVQFRQLPLTVGLAIGPISIGGAIITVALSEGPNGTYTAAGALAGRFTTASAFGLLSHYHYDSDGGSNALCGSDPLFSIVKGSVCNAADIMGLPSQDSTDAGCNALSFGGGYIAMSAHLGQQAPSQFPPAGCDGGIAQCD